ncbi:hypothetical protein FEM03_07445 [Phragmitibacter flavus]|uniref:Uncharacterized protein n=1 Tax=Phragmitibacter flavus TaxID=2576071 RepID=A0A5R8KGD5_9BACT|nr:hypothetical protein [Phragmitibacter flavus]TLD71356.1 hypothetical protein FEM03_07445 [Phragmitibacter flavus]
MRANPVHYLSYVNLQVSAGISHQRSNLIAMIKEAAVNQRTLIAPEFCLAGKHNLGRTIGTQLDEYFDFERVNVDGQPLTVLTQCPEKIGHSLATVNPDESLMGRSERWLIKDLGGISLLRHTLQNLYPGFADLAVRLPTRNSLLAIANQLSSQIPPGAAWVHARRSDRLQETQHATHPEHIHRILQKICPKIKTVYIATDERDADFFSPLRRHYHLLTKANFPSFEALGSTDNYKLFLVEREFAKFFTWRISTFRTCNINYHGFLCGRAGAQ